MFMYKTNIGLSPKIFQSYFDKIVHKYPTKFSSNNFVVPKYNSKLTSYSVLYRGPYLWKMFPKIVNTHKTSIEQFKNESKQAFLLMDFNISDFKCFF
jgi:hypothetical protein